ncbi:hypothetical protein [Pacificibacter marinus]|nr:hypothetical protein [Pacificibacter marinus]
MILTTPAIAQSGEDRESDCLLVVEAEEVIRGRCKFSPNGSDGSFVISSYNGKYFAYVIIQDAGIADGYWNGEPYARHAHDPLGVLLREEGCWVNERASVCAY